MDRRIAGRISPHLAGLKFDCDRRRLIKDNCAVDLSSKVLVVTGSDGDLGQAVAATLNGYGAKLALIDYSRTPPKLPFTGALHYGGIDLTVEAEARSTMQAVAKEKGRIDGLINIAGGFR